MDLLKLPEHDPKLPESSNISTLMLFSVRHNLSLLPPRMSYNDFRELLETEIELEGIKA